MGGLDKMWEERPSNDGNRNYPTYVTPGRPAPPPARPKPAPKARPKPKKQK